MSSSNFPAKMVIIELLQNKVIYSATLGTEGDMVVYTLVTQPGDTISGGNVAHSPPLEPYPSFKSEVNQQLTKTDALMTEDQRDVFQKLFRDFQLIFSKDSLDCGVTDLHNVRIPTDPKVPPTFAAYKSI